MVEYVFWGEFVVERNFVVNIIWLTAFIAIYTTFMFRRVMLQRGFVVNVKTLFLEVWLV
jgi:hypothetical protein